MLLKIFLANVSRITFKLMLIKVFLIDVNELLFSISIVNNNKL